MACVSRHRDRRGGLPLSLFRNLSDERLPVEHCCIVGIALLGFLYLPFNWGATNFIIYAAAFIGLATGFSSGVIALAVLLTLTALEMELIGFPKDFEISTR